MLAVGVLESQVDPVLAVAATDRHQTTRSRPGHNLESDHAVRVDYSNRFLDASLDPLESKGIEELLVRNETRRTHDDNWNSVLDLTRQPAHIPAACGFK